MVTGRCDPTRARRALPLRAAAAATCTAALVVAVVVAGCGSGMAAPPAPGSTVFTAPGLNGAPPAAIGASTASRPPEPARPPAPAHPIPASFGVAAGAPSDAEVRRELAQMYRVQRHQNQLLAQFTPAASTFADLLPWQAEPKLNQVSIASVFTDYGLGLACGGVLGRNQVGVAHKTAPCGTIIDFIYGGRELQVPVIDRGPYIAGREWDLTGAAAAALRFPGLGPIRWSVVAG